MERVCVLYCECACRAPINYVEIHLRLRCVVKSKQLYVRVCVCWFVYRRIIWFKRRLHQIDIFVVALLIHCYLWLTCVCILCVFLPFIHRIICSFVLVIVSSASTDATALQPSTIPKIREPWTQSALIFMESTQLSHCELCREIFYGVLHISSSTFYQFHKCAYFSPVCSLFISIELLRCTQKIDRTYTKQKEKWEFSIDELHISVKKSFGERNICRVICFYHRMETFKK